MAMYRDGADEKWDAWLAVRDKLLPYLEDCDAQDLLGLEHDSEALHLWAFTVAGILDMPGPGQALGELLRWGGLPARHGEDLNDVMYRWTAAYMSLPQTWDTTPEENRLSRV